MSIPAFEALTFVGLEEARDLEASSTIAAPYLHALGNHRSAPTLRDGLFAAIADRFEAAADTGAAFVAAELVDVESEVGVTRPGVGLGLVLVIEEMGFIVMA